MPRALKVCSTSGCPNLVPTGGKSGRCPTCLAKANAIRGTAAQRGYGTRHWLTQRDACLRRDLWCQCTTTTHGHGQPCMRAATVADHDPRERKDLVALGVPDPDALEYLKGKCASCHNRKTAETLPSGWASRHPA